MSKNERDEDLVPLSELEDAMEPGEVAEKKKPERKKKDITCNVVKVFSETDARGGVVRLQIVSWNGRTPMLEKREYYTDAEGNEKMGKAKGMNLEDLDIIWDKKEEIEKIMDKDSWKKMPKD